MSSRNFFNNPSSTKNVSNPEFQTNVKKAIYKPVFSNNNSPGVLITNEVGGNGTSGTSITTTTTTLKVTGNGSQGPQGPDGGNGLSGTPGAQGLQGPAGTPGATGLQGPAGIQGIQGIQGPIGIQGPTGATGPGYPQATPSTTGTALQFTNDEVYGSDGTPETGDITGDITSSNLGVTVLVIHNNSVAPTFDSKFHALSGSSPYVTGVNNYIYCTYLSDTKIIYAINQ